MRHLPLLAIAFALAVAPATAAPADRLPDGATIAGVPVGGLGPYGARVELQNQLRPAFETPIVVRIKGRERRVPTARLGQRIEYLRMVKAAFAQADRGQQVHVHLI